MEPTPENLRKIAQAMTVHGAIECLDAAADRIEELEAALREFMYESDTWKEGGVWMTNDEQPSPMTLSGRTITVLDGITDD